MVEADPARLIKVLPPLAGRVTQLKVQLGEQVEAGQPLVVIDSPDLAAAYADYDRAKVLLSLALKNRDRQRALVKIGGAADKDLQQGETDYATAEAELRRAEARLKQIGVDAETTSKARTVTVDRADGGQRHRSGGGARRVLERCDGSADDRRRPPHRLGHGRRSGKRHLAGRQGTGGGCQRSPPIPARCSRDEVLFVSDVLDPDTRRTKVRIAFDNPDTRLKPGMFANVRFHAPTQQRARSCRPARWC